MTEPGPADSHGAARELVTPERLRAFFAPRSIALVGASDNSGWARFIVASCATAGFAGPLTAVHPRATGAFGLPVVPSLRDLAEPADLAFILAPVQAVEGVLDDMGAAGIPNAVVLASGYREVGEAGRALEDALLDRAVANGVTVLGPNCLGFVNAHSRSAPYALALPPPLIAGPVGVALQSGALASVVLAFAKAHAIGLSLLTSMGNEAMMKTADVLDYLVEDEATRVICLFLEEIGDPARFARVAEKADRAGKPIVALKVGSSPAGQQAALAHTGSVAGDDAVVDAVLRQLNVIRVTSLEELLTTGAALGYNRWPRGRRMGVLTLSGGSCDIIADAASAQGVAIPDFSAETEAAIAALLPPFASRAQPAGRHRLRRAGQPVRAEGPADRGGPRARHRGAGPEPGLRAVLRGDAARGPAAGRGRGPHPGDPGGLAGDEDGLRADPDHPGRQHLRERQRLRPGAAAQARHHLPRRPGPGDDRAGPRAALAGEPGAGASASGPFGRPGAGRVRGPGRPVPGPRSQARRLLADAGVPVVPGGLAGSADEAVEIAGRVGLPVALKICSAQITHKSDIGGVVLGLGSEAEVRAGYEKVRAAGLAVPEASVDGVLVTPMRTGGAELLAGVTVDPAFGPVLAVGLGGIWVEVLNDTSLRLLPVDAAEVRRMLGELRGLPLLQGARGAAPASLDAVAEAIAGLGEVALTLNGCAARAGGQPAVGER